MICLLCEEIVTEEESALQWLKQDSEGRQYCLCKKCRDTQGHISLPKILKRLEEAPGTDIKQEK